MKAPNMKVPKSSGINQSGRVIGKRLALGALGSVGSPVTTYLVDIISPFYIL